MTRSEEQLRVGTQTTEAGRVRLRTFVTEENVIETVPVSREQVTIEREPITDGNLGKAMDGPAISEEEHEVVLHAEQAVVEKEAVRREQIEVEDGGADVYPTETSSQSETDSTLDVEPRR